MTAMVTVFLSPKAKYALSLLARAQGDWVDPEGCRTWDRQFLVAVRYAEQHESDPALLRITEAGYTALDTAK